MTIPTGTIQLIFDDALKTDDPATFVVGAMDAWKKAGYNTENVLTNLQTQVGIDKLKVNKILENLEKK